MIHRWLVVPLRKSRHRYKDDPLANKVYSMEREIIGQSVNTRCSRDHLRDVLSHACRKYKVDEPSLSFVRQPELRIFGWYDPGAITLNSGYHGCNMVTLLHELAHHIVDEKYERHENHGIEFVQVYTNLLDRYRIIPAYAFKVMLERHKITPAR